MILNELSIHSAARRALANRSKKSRVGREFQHLEDLVYIEGTNGVRRALEHIQHIVSKQFKSHPLEVKWDGSPAILFGRSPEGQFHFGDKYSTKILSSPNDVYQYYTRTIRDNHTNEQKFQRIDFAKTMMNLFKVYESATPENFTGYIEAGLMYSSRPELVNNSYSFLPNTVKYTVDANSELGKQISKSISGCAATAYFAELPALGGQRQPVGERYKLFANSRVVVIPPKFVSEVPSISNKLVDRIRVISRYASANSQHIENFIRSESGLSDIKNVIYSYINSQVDNPKSLNKLGSNFAMWVQTNNSYTDSKKAKIINRLKDNVQGATAVFKLVQAIMHIKDNIIIDLEERTLRSMGITAELKTGEAGGEGFVHDPRQGVGPVKFVRRGSFTRANRLKDELKESSTDIKKYSYDITKLFPNYELVLIRPIDDRKVKLLVADLKDNKKPTDKIQQALDHSDRIMKLSKEYYKKQPREEIKESIIDTEQDKKAVVGWGRGMGHKGHMYLAQAVIEYAERTEASPFFYVSETVGADDPLTPDEKLAIYKKVFPEHKNIFKTEKTPVRVAQQVYDMGFTDFTLIVGQDQVNSFQFLARPTKSTGALPVPFNRVEVISRQQANTATSHLDGPRATPMRQALLDPSMSESEQFVIWRDAMPDALSDHEVMKIMKLAKYRLTKKK